jgi:hypothetical protein
MGISLKTLKKKVPRDVYDEIKRKLRSPRDLASYTIADLERDSRHEPLAEKKAARFNTPVRIRIHSYRKKLADADGVSAKAAIDGLRYRGVLSDDTTAQICEIVFEQSHIKAGDEERTRIEIMRS